MRTFETGATRDGDETKYDYEGFLSPAVLARYAEYMHKNRVQADGTLRGSDNWQKGIPLSAYMKSGFRHFMDWWRLHRQPATAENVDAVEETLCAVMFNVMGYLHEILRRRSDQSQSDIFAKALVDGGLTGWDESAKVIPQRRSPWWPEERFGHDDPIQQ
jgi:hypothetical protein